MKLSECKPGTRVVDLLPSLGYGVIKKVTKTTVHVLFAGHEYVTVYDIPHIKFLEETK